MFKAKDAQGIISKSLVDDDLRTWINAFLIDRKAQGIQHDQTSQRIGLSSSSARDDHGSYYSISASWTNIRSGTNNGGMSQ